MAPKKNKPARPKGGIMQRQRQLVKQTRQVKQASKNQLPPKGGTGAAAKAGQRAATAKAVQANQQGIIQRGIQQLIRRQSARAKQDAAAKGQGPGPTRYATAAPKGGALAKQPKGPVTRPSRGAMTPKGGALAKSPKAPAVDQGIRKVSVRDVTAGKQLDGNNRTSVRDISGQSRLPQSPVKSLQSRGLKALEGARDLAVRNATGGLTGGASKGPKFPFDMRQPTYPSRPSGRIKGPISMGGAVANIGAALAGAGAQKLGEWVGSTAAKGFLRSPIGRAIKGPSIAKLDGEGGETPRPTKRQEPKKRETTRPTQRRDPRPQAQTSTRPTRSSGGSAAPPPPRPQANQPSGRPSAPSQPRASSTEVPQTKSTPATSGEGDNTNWQKVKDLGLVTREDLGIKTNNPSKEAVNKKLDESLAFLKKKKKSS